MFNKFLTREEGQGLVEYALILVLVAIVVIVILLQLGPEIGKVYCSIATVLQPGVCDNPDITVISGPTVIRQGLSNPPKYKLTMQVQVTKSPADGVMVSAGEVSQIKKDCTTCSFELPNLTSGSGTYAINAGSLGFELGSYAYSP